MRGKKFLILIPALNPKEDLLHYIDSLIENGFKNIVVINDGSNESHASIFQKIEAKDECKVLYHAINLGKGRAIKNGLNYYLNQKDLSEFKGVITVDSDGQHTCKDVIRIASHLQEDKKILVLGERDFRSKDNPIPFRSRVGNRLTSVLFQYLMGVRIQDTQTGLRGIPTKVTKLLVDCHGERFDYETNMLIICKRNQVSFVDVRIETIYLNNNESSHFHPIRDSAAIYKVLFGSFFKYIGTSLLSFGIDIALFYFFVLFLTPIEVKQRIFWAVILARVLSSAANYFINKHFVFHYMSRNDKSILKYYALCIIQMLLSAFIVTYLFKYIGKNEVAIKVFVDSTLFFISYFIQMRFVFAKTHSFLPKA